MPAYAMPTMARVASTIKSRLIIEINENHVPKPLPSPAPKPGSDRVAGTHRLTQKRMCTNQSPALRATLEIFARYRFHPGRARETVAIVGASVRARVPCFPSLPELDTPTRGTVRPGREGLVALNEDERAALRARKLGFVFQSFQLLGNLTALENVTLPLELAGHRDARRRAADMLGRVETCAAAVVLPQVLSGGEQQRGPLARAFVVQPAVLLADEPTGSLDFATGETIMGTDVRPEPRTGARPLVLVTHDRAIAERCDRRITIEAGRLV